MKIGWKQLTKNVVQLLTIAGLIAIITIFYVKYGTDVIDLNKNHLQSYNYQVMINYIKWSLLGMGVINMGVNLIRDKDVTERNTTKVFNWFILISLFLIGLFIAGMYWFNKGYSAIDGNGLASVGSYALIAFILTVVGMLIGKAMNKRGEDD